MGNHRIKENDAISGKLSTDDGEDEDAEESEGQRGRRWTETQALVGVLRRRAEASRGVRPAAEVLRLAAPVGI